MLRNPEGVGVSLRREHYDDALASERRVDWIEVQPENFMGMGGRQAHVLDACARRWPVMAHGVALSIGGPDPIRDDYVVPLRELLDRIEAPYFSEHVCYSAARGVVFHDLLPLPFTEEAVKHVTRRGREVMDRLERPLVLENITYYALMPGSAMTEGQFLTTILEELGAGLLLDVNNVYVNAKNHGRAPRDVLYELPLDRTREIHLAGHRRDGDVLIDDHGSAVISEVWELYREVIERIGPVATLIEWENALPSFDRLLDEADFARGIQGQALARLAS